MRGRIGGCFGARDAWNRSSGTLCRSQMRHRHGPGGVESREQVKRPCLFNEAQQGTSTLTRRGFRISRPVGRRVLVRYHLVAQSLQVGVINPIELHSKLENGDRNQLGRIKVAAGDERGPACFKGGKNRKQLVVWVNHRRSFHDLGLRNVFEANRSAVSHTLV